MAGSCAFCQNPVLECACYPPHLAKQRHDRDAATSTALVVANPSKTTPAAWEARAAYWANRVLYWALEPDTQAYPEHRDFALENAMMGMQDARESATDMRKWAGTLDGSYNVLSGRWEGI